MLQSRRKEGLQRATYFGIECWVVQSFSTYSLIAMVNNTRHLVESKDLTLVDRAPQCCICFKPIFGERVTVNFEYAGIKHFHGTCAEENLIPEDNSLPSN
jgi:hypothetical protein